MTPTHVQAAQVTLAWDADPSVAGYMVYYGSTAGQYEGSVDVGLQTTSTLVDLEEGKAYYFAVVSYDADGEESEPAPEVVFGGPREGSAGEKDHDEGVEADKADSPRAADQEDIEGDAAEEPALVDPAEQHAEIDEAPESVEPSTDPQVIPQAELRIIRVSSEPLVGDGAAEAAIDGRTETFWHTEMGAKAPLPPHELVIALGGEYIVRGFRYLPRQDGKTDGMVARYSFYVSEDGVNWGKAVATGTFPRHPTEQTVVFSGKQGGFVRFVAHTEMHGNPWTSMAEINVLAIR